MAPRDFSQDGAVGAGDNGSGLSSAPGQQTGGFTQQDSFNQQSSSGSTPLMTNPVLDMSGAAQSDIAPSYVSKPSYTPTAANPNPLQSQMAIDQAAFNRNSIYPQNGYMRVAGGYAGGGAIEDDTNGSPEQDQITKALASVDQVLAYGRKLHGLGGDNEGGAIDTAAAMPMIPGNQSETPGPYRPGGGGQKMAANMPMVPGSQSNSGIPPQRPAPGPLPPTSNPFGKRADAGSTSDQDNDNDSDQPGAIDTDEEAA